MKTLDEYRVAVLPLGDTYTQQNICFEWATWLQQLHANSVHAPPTKELFATILAHFDTHNRTKESAAVTKQIGVLHNQLSSKTQV